MKKKFYSMLIVVAMILSNLTPTFAEPLPINEEAVMMETVEPEETIAPEETVEPEENVEPEVADEAEEMEAIAEAFNSMGSMIMSLEPQSNTSNTYVPFATPRPDGYFKFYEDFTQFDTKFETLSSFAANGVIAERPDGVAWKGTKWNQGKAMIGANGLTLKGNTTPGNPPVVKIDMSEALESVDLRDTDIPQDKQKITFEINGGEIGGGPVFFLDENQVSFIWMGTYTRDGVNYFFDQVDALKRNGSAFVAFFKGGKVTNDNFISTTVDLSAGSRWEVSVDEDILSWKVYDIEGTKVWEEKAPLDDRYKKGRFVNLFGYGSGGANDEGILKNISYETGKFYTKEIGEPMSTIYLNVMDRAKQRNDLEGEVYEFSETADIKRVEFTGYSGNSFSLGYDEGGSITWDTFTKNDGNENGEWIVLGEGAGLSRWLNTYTTKKYKYIKAPTGDGGSGELKAFENIAEDATIRLNSNNREGAPATRDLYLSDGDGWEAVSTMTGVSENNSYITVDNSGSTAGKLALTGVKGTYRLDEEGETLSVTIDSNGTAAGGKMYTVNVVVEGPLTDMQNGMITEEAYVTSQQTIITALNDAIMTGNEANINNFFNPAVGYESKNVSELDFIDASVFSGADANFANRIMSYGGTLSAGTTLEELENLCDILTMESYVGRLDGLAAKAIAGTEQKKNEDGSDMVDGNGDPVYYTEGEADLLTKDRLSECLDTLDLPLNNKYYVSENGSDSSFAAGIRSRIAQITNFDNVSDLVETINEAVLMTVFENNDNASYMVQLFRDYADTLVLSADDKEKLEVIASSTDKASKFATAIKDAAEANPAAYDTSAELKGFITNYAIPAEPTQRPTSNSSSTGNGGFSGVVPQPSTTKQPDNTVVEKTQIFDDVPVDFWGYEAIRYMHAREAVSGYPNGDFGPNNTLTKAELIQMIIGLFDPDVEIPEDYVIPFGDVSEDAWYYKSMVIANVYGVFAGDGQNAKPAEYVNRQEMATMIYRAIEKSGRTLSRDVEIQKFGDEGMIADWAYTPIAKMQAAGIVAGSNGNFNPTGNSTRAEAAQMLYKAMQGFESPVVSEEEAK